MIELIFATNNVHKLQEVREIMGSRFRILSMKDVGLDIGIPEDQDTIEGNARQKARFVFEKTGKDCFADDTGLFVDILDGRPGVFSARYAGENCDFDDNIRKLLSEIDGLENRKANFRCVVCLIYQGKEYCFEGRIDGKITYERKGNTGFGYDPVFLPDGSQQTFAEMPPYLKNGISHRGMAISRLLRFFK
jgi:XTP/dITP diphosphohydrolase